MGSQGDDLYVVVGISQLTIYIMCNLVNIFAVANNKVTAQIFNSSKRALLKAKSY